MLQCEYYYADLRCYEVIFAVPIKNDYFAIQTGAAEYVLPQLIQSESKQLQLQFNQQIFQEYVGNKEKDGQLLSQSDIVLRRYLISDLIPIVIDYVRRDLLQEPEVGDCFDVKDRRQYWCPAILTRIHEETYTFAFPGWSIPHFNEVRAKGLAHAYMVPLGQKTGLISFFFPLSKQSFILSPSDGRI